MSIHAQIVLGSTGAKSNDKNGSIGKIVSCVYKCLNYFTI